MFMGWTGPYSKLTSERPPGALISLPVLFSVLGAVACELSAQLFMNFYVKDQSFYEPFEPNPEAGVLGVFECYE